VTLKKIIGTIHLWLGLSSGLVVFIISLTGCIYAFQDEIQNVTQSYRYAGVQNKPVLAPSVMKAIAEKELPGKKVHAVMYNPPGRAAQVIFYDFDPLYYYFVYLDPYSGRVLKVKDENADFFRIVLDGHFYLWLPPEIGQPVVASATLVFVVMLITGIVLWWPKNKAAARQRFSIKWTARWRRKNYDLHNVLGFYASWIAIILAVTGLVWGFQWFASSYYAIAGGEKSMLYEEPLSDTLQMAQINHQSPVIDQLWQRAKREHPWAAVMEVHIPETAKSSVSITLNPESGTYWKTDYRFYDQYTLRELPVQSVYGKLAEAKAADKLLRMNYDIHVGAIIGLPGKIIAFMASLFCASLPVTGFYIWWGRRRKNHEGAEETAASTAATAPKVRPRVIPVMRKPVLSAVAKEDKK
jgi:uncharacterized iron-regulated membrane protein